MSFRYTDPGDGRLLTVSKTVVRCNVASKTGVAFYQTNKSSCFNIPELSTVKEMWVKFDVYLYGKSLDDDYSQLRCYWITADNKTTGVQICNSDPGNVFTGAFRVWGNGVAQKELWQEMAGLHSVKVYIKSHISSGAIKVYLDNNSTATYTYSGSLLNGEYLKNFFIQSDNRKVLISNIIISSSEPNIGTNVPYEKSSYKYINYGTADGLTVPANQISGTTKSRTGTAFYQTAQPTNGIFGAPAMDEVWIKFDLYHTSGTSRFRCYANANKATGICLTQGKSDTLTVFADNYTGSTSASKVVGDKIQTYIVHMTSNGKKGYGKVEAWIDNEKVLDFTRNYSVSPFEGLYLQSDNANNVFSNIVISDNQANLTIPVRTTVDTHADIKLAIQNRIERHVDIAYEINSYDSTEINIDMVREVNKTERNHIDIQRESVDLRQAHYFDILRFIKHEVNYHADMVLYSHNDRLGLYRYENQGYHDDSLTPVYGNTASTILCKSTSQTGVGMSHNAYIFPYWTADISAANANEIWIKVDVFAWDEKTLAQPNITFYFDVGQQNPPSKKAVGVFFCATKDGTTREAGFKIWETDSYNPVANYAMNKLIGFHTLRIHLISEEANGLIECFLDNNSSPSCVFHGNVFDGQAIQNVMINGGYFLTISNMIIDTVEPSVNEIVTHSDKTDFAWLSSGRIEDLSSETVTVINGEVFTGGVAYAEQIKPTGTTVQTTSKSRTGTAFYQTNSYVPCVSMPIVDEMWVQFDLYHHGETFFSCFITPSSDNGIGTEPCRNLGLRLKNGTSNQIEVVIGQWVLTTVDITPDTIQTYRMCVVASAEKANIKLWIDGEKVADYQIDRGVGYFESPCFYSTNEDNLFSSIAVSNDRAMLGASNVECHADIVREVTANSSTPEVWRYENPGVIDGEWGTSSDKQYWSDRHLFEIHGAVSKTGTAIAQKDPDAYPHLYFKLPDEAKYFDELWVKFDWCICAHGGYKFPYLWMSGYAIDINGASHLRNVSEDGEVLIAPDGRSIPASVPPNNNPYEADTTWVDTTISFSVHTLMLHYVFDYTDGLFEAYLDDDSVPIYSASGRMRPIDEVTMEIADIGISNIVISNEKVDFNEVIGRIHIPNTEGVATHKTIDLEKELTVGIGISIEGEGYAMIRTAGEDGHYTAWENYIPCERLCRYIDVRLHVRNKITSATLTVDKRTISKTISKHLIAGDNTIEYGEAFYNVPAVIPTAIGDGVTAHVISKDAESCVIKITDNNNNTVEGDVDILIRGW